MAESEKPGETIWAWQTQVADESWSAIGASIPGVFNGEVTPLYFRKEELARLPIVEKVARTHGQTLNQPVRLARFELAEIYP